MCASDIAHLRDLVSVRVHADQQMDSRLVDQASYALVVLIVFAQIFGQQQKHFTADHFVSVHIGDVLEFGNTFRVLAGRASDFQHPEITILYALANAVQTRDGRIVGGQLV